MHFSSLSSMNTNVLNILKLLKPFDSEVWKMIMVVIKLSKYIPQKWCYICGLYIKILLNLRILFWHIWYKSKETYVWYTFLLSFNSRYQQYIFEKPACFKFARKTHLWFEDWWDKLSLGFEIMITCHILSFNVKQLILLLTAV